MRTSLTLARAQLTRGWTSLIGLTVLIAIVGGLVFAGFAGAQRTRTAVDRMIVATKASDVLVNPSFGDESALDFDAVAALPMVASYSRVYGVGVFGPPPYASLEELFSGSPTFASDGGAIFEFDTPVLVAGRLPNIDAIDEVYVSESFARRGGLAVGDDLVVRVIPYDVLGEAFALTDVGDIDGALALMNQPTIGRTAELQVTGIGNALDDVAIDEGYEPFGTWIGPAVFADLGMPSAGFGGAVIKLTSPDALPAFKAAVDALAPGEKIVYQSLPVTRAKALRATQPSATALALFAAVTALLGALLIGQAISRRFQLDARDNDTLAALGATRAERFVAALWRLLPAATLGVMSGVVFATLLSVFTPVGPAATAEPNPGFNFDAPILLIGAGVMLLVVMLLGAVPAWRNAGLDRRDQAVRGSALAGWLGEQWRIGPGDDRRSIRTGTWARPHRRAHPCHDHWCSDRGGGRDRHDRLRVEPRPCGERRSVLRFELRPGDRCRRTLR